MQKIVIHGGRKLFGKVRVHGAKNSTLPIMAASLLNSGITIIENVPQISDVSVMEQILGYLGCIVNHEENTMVIDSRNAVFKPLPLELTDKLRASSVLIGPMLVRFGKAVLATPGGCNIGSRPLDIHLEAMKLLGARWEADTKKIVLEAGKLNGANIFLRFPSVGATQNAIMAAALIRGRTVIRNAAREPEISHLCQYLRKIGADIKGDGTDTICINGVDELNAGEYTIAPDRIVAGTYIAAVMVCGGDILLKGVRFSDLESFINIYIAMGLKCKQYSTGLRVVCNRRMNNINSISTGPYPEFPTDMQSITMAVAATANGELTINENIFENRFMIAGELNAMGACVEVSGITAKVKGVKKLSGANVVARDLRGAAALVVAGLGARGVTVVNDAHYICRGYADIDENFRKLGADIRWLDD